MSRIYRLFARMLVVTMVWVPYSVHAGLVSTGEVVAGARGDAGRNAVVEFLDRDDVARQLEAFGLSAATAKERVNSLTQEELARLAGRIHALPAGAADTWVWVTVILALIIYFVYFKR